MRRVLPIGMRQAMAADPAIAEGIRINRAVGILYNHSA